MLFMMKVTNNPWVCDPPLLVCDPSLGLWVMGCRLLPPPPLAPPALHRWHPCVVSLLFCPLSKSFARCSCDFRTHHLCGLLWSGETHVACCVLLLWIETARIWDTSLGVCVTKLCQVVAAASHMSSPSVLKSFMIVLQTCTQWGILRRRSVFGVRNIKQHSCSLLHKVLDWTLNSRLPFSMMLQLNSWTIHNHASNLFVAMQLLL